MSDRTPLILLVEDEPSLAAGIRDNLEDEGYRVEHVTDGRSGLRRLQQGGLDLVVLDVMLPELDGYTVCELARAQGIDTPILFLTAKGTVDDRLRGLRAGGDDYLAKPFHLEELLLRVAAILRRGSAPSGESFEFGGNRVDFSTYEAVDWRGDAQQLSHKELKILETLVRARGAVVSREQILDSVWGRDAFPTSRTIDNFVVRLRRRFERDPDQPRFITTVRGIGYRFVFSDGDDAS